MKKLVLAALLASCAFGASAAEKINFGVSATYPPFESIGANNEIVGFDIDLAKALCKQMQAECTFTNHAFDSLIPSLKFKSMTPLSPVWISRQSVASRYRLPRPTTKTQPS